MDAALIQSGKFQEALDGLAKWLTDTEEMVANQKPPSADYKVVKAQLQEQKFLKKMLTDRQTSMQDLFQTGSEIAKEADPAERKAIEKQLKNLIGRFNTLTEGAQQRTLDLEQAMKVAKEFQDKLIPLQEWLDKSERKVKDMELIPTDEEKIQQRIREHEVSPSNFPFDTSSNAGYLFRFYTAIFWAKNLILANWRILLQISCLSLEKMKPLVSLINYKKLLIVTVIW